MDRSVAPASAEVSAPPPPLHPWRRVSLVPDSRSGLPTPKHRVVASSGPLSPNSAALEGAAAVPSVYATANLGALTKLLDDLHYVQEEVLMRTGHILSSNPTASSTPITPGLAPPSEPPSGGISPVHAVPRPFDADTVLHALEALDAVGTRFVAKELLLSIQRYLRAAPSAATAGLGRQLQALRLNDGPHDPLGELSVRETSDLGAPMPLPAAFDFGRRRDSCFSVMSAVHQVPVKATTQLHLTEHADGEAINQLLIIDDIVAGVKLCLDQDAKEYRVVKVLRRPHRFGTAGRTLEEIAIWKKLRHKNIVTLHEVIDDPSANHLYLVMQYVEHGPLVETVEDPIVHSITCNLIEPFRLVHYARQIAAGLAYLHNHGVVHNDIKPGNILLGRDDHVFLADFGVSEFWSLQLDHSATTVSPRHNDQPLADRPRSPGNDNFPCNGADGSQRSTLGSSPTTPAPRRVGTRAFFAPELLDPSLAKPAPNLSPAELRDHWLEVRKAGDIWALGVTFFLMLTGHLPFVDPPPKRSLRGDGILSPNSQSSASPRSLRTTQCYQEPVFWERYQLAVLSAPVEYPSSVPPEWRELITALLQKDRKRRVDIHTARGMIKSLKLLREPTSGALAGEAAGTPKVEQREVDSAESSLRISDSRRSSTAAWAAGPLNRPRLVPLVTREIETAVTIRREPTRAYKEQGDEGGLSCTEVPLSSHPMLGRNNVRVGTPPIAADREGGGHPVPEAQGISSVRREEQTLSEQTRGEVWPLEESMRRGKTTSPSPAMSRETSPVPISGHGTPVPITLESPNQESC